MSIATILDNLAVAISKMVNQFNTEEPLISEETLTILNDPDGRNQINDILKHPKAGKVTITVKGRDTTLFVEA